MENPRCYFCGGELTWDNDENLEAIGGAEDDWGVVTFLHCKHCGRDYEIADPPAEERDTTYRGYWHKANES